MGNLDPVQYQKLRELEQQLLQVNADYAAQEAIFNQQADHTGEKIEEIKKAIRQKKVLLTAAANYAAKRAEMTFENLSSGPVKIRLYEVLKTTGEVKDVFRFTYNGRGYRRLSRSEKALAGIYTVEMVNMRMAPPPAPGSMSPGTPKARWPVSPRAGSKGMLPAIFWAMLSLSACRGSIVCGTSPKH